MRSERKGWVALPIQKPDVLGKREPAEMENVTPIKREPCLDEIARQA